MRLVWNSEEPMRLVRGEMENAPRPDRKRSHPRVEGLGYRSAIKPSQVGADADPRKDNADNACPGVQGNAHKGSQNPSGHQLDDKGAETRDKDDDIGLNHFFAHLFSVSLRLLLRIKVAKRRRFSLQFCLVEVRNHHKDDRLWMEVGFCDTEYILTGHGLDDGRVGLGIVKS